MPEWAVATIVEVISVACVIHLWTRANGSAARKLAWTPVVLVPLLGPLFYGGLYSVPSVQNGDLRATDSELDDETIDIRDHD
jgi:hypothetical protein